MTTIHRGGRAISVAALVAGFVGLWGGTAAAQWSPYTTSEVDPAIFKIDEARFLGTEPAASLAFHDQNGRPVTLGDFRGQPLILVLSYYGCDGACSLVNGNLADLLRGVKRLKPGRDYRILTVSFDPRDTADSLAAFEAKFDAEAAVKAAWTLALPDSRDDGRQLADSIGFKYFWSPGDGVFLHPGVFAFLSPQGRVVRFLYGMNTRSFDVEMALLDARQDRAGPGNATEVALSLCYSYNFKEGRYALNIPVIIGLGSLAVGIGSLLGSLILFKRRARKGEIIR
jgi:protein SCO1/2